MRGARCQCKLIVIQEVIVNTPEEAKAVLRAEEGSWMKNRVKKLLAKTRELPCQGCGARLDQPQRHPLVAMLEAFHLEDQRRMLWQKITPDFPQGFYSDLRNVDRDEPLSNDEAGSWTTFWTSTGAGVRAAVETASTSRPQVTSNSSTRSF